jgi:hypothetical protein
MYKCYICTNFCKTTAEFTTHFKHHREMGQLVYPVLCRQGTCKGSYSTLFNFLRHIHSFHRNEETDCAESYHDADMEYVGVVGKTDDDNSVVSSTKCNVVDFAKDIRTEGVSLIAGLRANSSMPYSVIPHIVESFNNIADSVSSLVQNEVITLLSDSGLHSTVTDQIARKLDLSLEACRKPLDFLSTGYRQDTYFRNHPLAVTPERVHFAPRLESHGGSSSFRYDCFQYVSVEKTLKSLLQNEAYVQALLQDKCRPGVLASFADGNKYKQHPLFSDCSKFSIMLQLFYDGLGVTNALRSQGSVHNVGVFFYTIQNLPEQFNSCFGNVHLLALCYAHDLAVYGFQPVLNKFVAEMKHLSTAGFFGNFPVLGECTVYASLSQVTCDNLALNGLLGFIESFSGSYFCTVCYATSDDIQTCFSEEMFQKRTFEEYNRDLKNLPFARSQGKNHSRGVKTECVLNQIDGFHVTDNWSLDTMHILLEGVVPVELGCILYGLSVVDKCITLEKVNKEFTLLWGKITIDKTHKPAEIARLQEPGHAIVPSMKAVQYWALLKFLPLAVGRWVPAGNQHWQFLLHLSHLVDLIFARHFTHDMVMYMKTVISEHLARFVQLYGSDSVKLRPKHHFLVHLPTVILKSGPLSGMSCMRYELKNSFFKRCAHIVCNFTNICHTLANRHQQHALFTQLSNSHIRSGVLVAKHGFVSVKSLAYCNNLCSSFDVEPTDMIAFSESVKVATVEYKKGHLVLVSMDSNTGEPVFGQVSGFISHRGDDVWHIVCEKVITKEYVHHLHSYKVDFVKPAAFSFHRLKDLVDYHPLYSHTLFVGESKLHFVRLPYHIF